MYPDPDSYQKSQTKMKKPFSTPIPEFVLHELEKDSTR